VTVSFPAERSVALEAALEAVRVAEHRAPDPATAP
jgi:hypothetical protein